jgi:hypothetical protein
MPPINLPETGVRQNRLMPDLEGVNYKNTEVFKLLDIGSKYGPSTTHLNKLIPKIEGGSARGCPLLVIAVKPVAYVADI